MALALEGTAVHKNITSGSSTTMGNFTTSNPARIYIAGTINGTSISSITGGGLTWTQRVGTSTTDKIELWSAPAASSLSAVGFLITLVGSTSFSTFDVFAFSGQDTSGSPWDGNASVPGQQSTADPILVSTNNANDVVIACFRSGSISNPSPGAGFAAISGVAGADFQLCMYQIVSATQTNLSCGLIAGSGGSNGCLVDALMQSSGAATRPVKMAGEWGGYAGSSGGFAGRSRQGLHIPSRLGDQRMAA